MQSRSARMGIVLDLAQKDEDKASDTLSQCRSQLQNEEVQLQQLFDYRAQYLQDYSAKETGLNAAQFINYSSFIQRIDTLTQEQQSKVERAKRIVDQAQRVWQQYYRKRQSIAELIARYKIEEDMAMEKKLQKEIDDLTTQRFSRQKDQS